MMEPSPSPPIRIGISSCLTGEKVRFDAGHKQDAYILGTLAHWFELVPVCPEVGIGMGVPRKPIRLVGDPDAPRAIGTSDPGVDVTEALRDFGRGVARRLPDLSGYIFKSRSPSCGMERVKVYRAGQPAKAGTGIYARALMDALPLLPVEEEGRLGDPVLRENFIERVFAYRRWQDLERLGITPARLVAFHTAHKLILMAHGTVHYHELGALVARAGALPRRELAERYVRGFMEALRHRATRKRHSNVLMHLMGYLKRRLDAADKAEMGQLIEDYRLGRVPLVVPITLLKHHFRRHPDAYVGQQLYLEPHPPELMLRNLV